MRPIPVGTIRASGTSEISFFSCFDWLASVLPQPVKVTFFMLAAIAAHVEPGAIRDEFDVDLLAFLLVSL